MFYQAIVDTYIHSFDLRELLLVIQATSQQEKTAVIDWLILLKGQHWLVLKNTTHNATINMYVESMD